MRNAGVALDADKIAFVRSHVVQDSLAGHLMGASSFSPSHVGDCYDEFRPNFLKAFSLPSTTSMQWVHRLRSLLLE